MVKVEYKKNHLASVFKIRDTLDVKSGTDAINKFTPGLGIPYLRV